MSTLTSKDHNYPPCIGDNGPMTSGDCARWLEAKYSRHHELEDQASAQMIRNQAQEIHRLRAIIEGNKAHGFETGAVIVGWMVGTPNDNPAMYNLAQRQEAFKAAGRWDHPITALMIHPEAPKP